MDNRELDRRVAEVLGYEFGNAYGGEAFRGRDGSWIVTPRYSTDIASAIGALEQFCKMRKLSAKIEILEEGGCEVYIRYTDKGYAKADAIPLAICAAILTATPKVGE